MRHIIGIFITALLLFMFLMPAFAEQPSSGIITPKPTLSEMATQGSGPCMAACQEISTNDLEVNLVIEAGECRSCHQGDVAGSLIEHNQFMDMRDLRLRLREPDMAIASRDEFLITIWIEQHTLTDTYTL